MSANHRSSSRAFRGRYADKGGFTLIEVLVAFAVLATLLSVLYRGVVGLRAGSIAFDDHTVEDIIVRKIFDEALARRDLRAGTYAGLRDGRHWILITKPIDLSWQFPPPEQETELKIAGSSQLHGATDGGKNPEAEKDGKVTWRTQRLIVRVETNGRPLEIETIRLVNLEGGR